MFMYGINTPADEGEPEERRSGGGHRRMVEHGLRRAARVRVRLERLARRQVGVLGPTPRADGEARVSGVRARAGVVDADLVVVVV